MKKVIIGLNLVIFITICIFGIITKNNQTSAKNEEGIQGIILPHHGLASGILNTSFIKLKSNINPKIIVIYGTNHYFPISPTFTTTEKIKSEFGLVNTEANDARIEKDHSIGTLVPYIKNYFPEARIIPIIVSARYKDISELALNSQIFTSKFGWQETLYIASVDFAHNVNLDQGLANNSESINTIKSFDYPTLLNYRDEHMDSPTAISTFLMSMQNLNAPTWNTWYSSHGALITAKEDLEGTSYVVGVFTKK